MESKEHPQATESTAGKESGRAEALKTAVGPEAFISFATGQVRLLDLETIRASLGPRWPRLSNQVHMVVETILRRVIGPADLFVQVDESEYLIAFPHANEQQASAITSMAAEQIRQKLFGQNPAFKGTRVSAMVQMVQINATDAASDPAGAVQAAVAAAKQAPAAPRSGAPAGGAVPPASTARPGPGAGLSADAAIASSLEALGTSGAASKGQWTAQKSTAATSVQAGAAAPRDPAPAKAAAPAEPLPDIRGLHLAYRPVWDPSRQAVNASHLVVVVEVDGAQMALSDFTAQYDSAKTIAAINGLVLRRLVAGMQGMQAAGHKSLVLFPVNRQFIDTETGLRLLLDQLQLIPEAIRPLVVPEITDAYFGSWPALAPAVAVIRRACRAVCVRLSLDHKDFAAVAATGVSLVSGHLADHDWPERQSLAAMNGFAELAAKAGLKTVVGGLDTSSLVIAAMSAGVNLLSGAAIGDGEETPPAQRALSVEGFYLGKYAAAQRD